MFIEILIKFKFFIILDDIELFLKLTLNKRSLIRLMVIWLDLKLIRFG
jgi:hypothetical protein